MKQRLRAACAAGALAVALALIGSSRAHAFQNPARFLDDPVEKGGGGQRFFTGSPADGYTCKVCHTKGEPVHVDVSGIPVDGFVPGKVYPILIDWADDLKAVGLNAEITDGAGHAAGELKVPMPAEVTPADLCSAGPMTGSGVFPLETRAVALVGECGQRQTTLLWTAPTAPVSGGVWFSGSLVVSDSNGDVVGDSVTDIRRALAPQGSQVVDTMTVAKGEGCAVQHPIGRAPRAWAVSALLLALCCLRRRARTNSRHEGA